MTLIGRLWDKTSIVSRLVAVDRAVGDWFKTQISVGSYPSLLQQVPDLTICGDNFISLSLHLVSSSRSEMILFSLFQVH